MVPPKVSLVVVRKLSAVPLEASMKFPCRLVVSPASVPWLTVVPPV